MMRRVFALLLVTPLLANCSDSVTPVAPSEPSGPVHTLVESPLDAAWTESPFDNWTLEEWVAQQTLEESPLQVAPGSGVLMEFGNPRAGSPFPPGVHDASFHGADRVIPGTVTIDAGQTVTFRVYPGHRVGIYNKGVRPEDITINPASFFVLDAKNRIALQAAPVPVISFKFHFPGRYLVICAIRTHFVNANMYGWVIVR